MPLREVLISTDFSYRREAGCGIFRAYECYSLAAPYGLACASK